MAKKKGSLAGDLLDAAAGKKIAVGNKLQQKRDEILGEDQKPKEKGEGTSEAGPETKEQG